MSTQPDDLPAQFLDLKLISPHLPPGGKRLVGITGHLPDPEPQSVVIGIQISARLRATDQSYASTSNLRLKIRLTTTTHQLLHTP